MSFRRFGISLMIFFFIDVEIVVIYPKLQVRKKRHFYDGTEQQQQQQQKRKEKKKKGGKKTIQQ